MKFILIFTMFLIFFSCNRKTFEIVLTIKELKNQEWLVTYKLPAKVSSLFFFRHTNLFRKANWQLEDKRQEIVEENGWEKIVSKTPFDTIVLRTKVVEDKFVKDYSMFAPFGDGSILMYSGHYYVRSDISQYRIIVKPLNKKEYSIIDNDKEGKYLFFGDTEKVKIDKLSYVIDGKMPYWLKNNFKKYLPKLIDYYHEKTSYQLRSNWEIFISYVERPELKDRTSSGGDVLKGQVQFHFEGVAWKKESKKLNELAVGLIAHEVAHFWNSDMFSSKGLNLGSIWMYEGGADAFANRALRDLGVIDEVRLKEISLLNKKKCLEGIKGISLSLSAEKRRFKNFYKCGAVLADITEHMVGGDLYIFWKELFDSAVDGTYNERLYFEVLRRISKNDVKVDQLQAFLYEIDPIKQRKLLEL